jgi:hypothetical protein
MKYDMKMIKWLSPLSLLMISLLFSSCATTMHPNEQILVGNWKPEKVERIYTPEERQKMEELKKQQASQPVQTGTTASGTEGQKPAKTKQGVTPNTNPVNVPKNTQQQGGTAQNTQQGNQEARTGNANLNVTKQEAGINNLIRAEQHADLRITADKFVVKNYPGKTIKATWKLNRKGNVMTAKNLETKEKFKLDLLEVTPTRVVVQENLPNATLQITYLKQN